jgi:hypothetical protein
MADLEEAAGLAAAKVKDLSERVDGAEAVLADVEEKLDAVRESLDADWTGLEERLRAVLTAVRAQAAGIAEDGQQAREDLVRIDRALHGAASEWDAAFEAAGATPSRLASEVSDAGADLIAGGNAAAAALEALADRATTLEAQLEQAVTATREMLEEDVLSEVREMRDVVRERITALQALLEDECAGIVGEAFAAWQQRLAEVEDMIGEEFAGARQHAADVVQFSLQECRRGHEDAWAEIAPLAATLDGLLQGLAEAVRARAGEVATHRGAAAQALSEASASVERARAAFAAELQLLSSFEFAER